MIDSGEDRMANLKVKKFGHGIIRGAEIAVTTE